MTLQLVFTVIAVAIVSPFVVILVRTAYDYSRIAIYELRHLWHLTYISKRTF
jgi:hypothetical protein